MWVSWFSWSTPQTISHSSKSHFQSQSTTDITENIFFLLNRSEDEDLIPCWMLKFFIPRNLNKMFRKKKRDNNGYFLLFFLNLFRERVESLFSIHHFLSFKFLLGFFLFRRWFIFNSSTRTCEDVFFFTQN